MADVAFGIADRERKVRTAPPARAIAAHALRRMAASLASVMPRGAPRFLIAGALASSLNWLVRFPLSAVLPFGLAVAAAYGAGMVVGFVLYRNWVFPGSAVPLRQQVVRFLAVNAAGVAVVVAVAKLLLFAVNWLAILPPDGAQAVAHAIAIAFGAAVNFAGHRALTFSRQILSDRILSGQILSG